MSLEAALQQLRERPKISGWATSLQITCGALWKALANKDPLAQSLVEEFCAMLHQDDSFDVARFAIPELRGFTDGPLSVAQRRILELTSDLHQKIRDQSAVTQDDFDSQLYREEKDILLDAEVNRASLLIHSSGALDPASAEDIRRWLDQRPGRRDAGEFAAK